MQLLVSVRSAGEVTPALAGGADIIDAKEPLRGSLGPVDPSVLGEISARVPPSVPLSVALGDFQDGGAAADAISALELIARPGGVFVKLGLAGVVTSGGAATLFRSAVEAAGAAACHPSVVAVAYADRRAGLGPGEIARSAAQAGAEGVLLDTLAKDGRDLFAFMSPRDVKFWVESARAAGLIVGIAGSLRPENLESVREIGPDILGVRGAACAGGRGGSIDVEKVRALRLTLARIGFGECRGVARF
ncbi:MAG: (5-formylfuran-3-yl)methyl phosphate synthase [Gemmatimonadales bacterium]